MGVDAPRNDYLVALGSNLGDRQQNLVAALNELTASHCSISQCSSFYETQPLGAADQPFINAAAIVESALTPEAMLTLLLSVEAKLGRVRTTRWGNRSIDLDILLWRTGSQTLGFKASQLTIPHPEMLNRDFVLVPATEIAANWLHPETGLTLTHECSKRRYHLLPIKVISRRS